MGLDRHRRATREIPGFVFDLDLIRSCSIFSDIERRDACLIGARRRTLECLAPTTLGDGHNLPFDGDPVVVGDCHGDHNILIGGRGDRRWG